MANYENDIYLMLPLADNQKNWRLDELGVLKQASLDKQTAYASVADDFLPKPFKQFTILSGI